MAKIERQKRIYRKRIPYGMQNFEDVMERDCYYVDKTPFIEKIEESNMYFFFIRPRRFGKSLTLSMLENYYDINKKDKFESLFGKLYIGENPTPERNSYLILHLNFAMISAGLDNYKKDLMPIATTSSIPSAADTPTFATGHKGRDEPKGRCRCPIGISMRQMC